jgi:hypothetical protein
VMRWRLEREASEAEARKRQRREECRKLAEKARQEALKGPKLEIFGFRVFSQIRPVWVGDLGTRQKNSKF